jgi:hypothetical protein
MKRVLTEVFGALVILFLTCTGLWAQATSSAQISGTVKDQSGAVLPGTEIQVTQTATGAVRNAVSGEDGAYVITNLPIGPYMLEVTLSGFRTYVQTGIVLQVNSSPTVNAVLEVGQVSETVEVQADAAMVETRSTGVGTVIDNSRILELPLNGRQVTQLIFLAGMASPSVGSISTGINSTRNYPTVMIALAGGAGDGVTYLLDGANHNDPHNSLNYPLPFPDALQEFKVEASALPAQYGYHSNAAISAVTKSGTNRFHGNLFEFVRNGVFNARNFFAPRRDTLKRNQFGGVIGGPIIKDKLFFFGGYQATLERSDPPTAIAYVPTPAMLAGDFTTMASPACNGRQLTLAAAQGFVNNQISPSRFDPVALRISSLLPTTSDPCGKVTFGLKSNSDEHLFLGRIDYQRTQRDSIFGRIWIANLVRQSTYDGKNPLSINNSQSNFRITSFVLGNTRLLSASTVSSFRTSFSRGMVEKPLDQFYTWGDLGVRNVTPLLGKTMAITVQGTGFSFGGGNALLNKGPSQNFNIAEDINVLKGAHQIAFGGSYIHARYFQNGPQSAPGQMAFNGSVSGMPLADFLLGNASGWNQGNVSWQYTNQHYLGLFLQDTWKANGRFTVSYGLRWEPYMAPYDSNNRFSHFDSALFDQNVKSTVYVNAPAGRIFSGDPQYKVGNAPHNSRYPVFLPRVGLAWDPQGDGRTAVRAAYGIFTYRKEMHSYVNFTIQSPFGNRVDLTNVRMSDPWGSYAGGNPFPLVLDKNVPFPTYGSTVTHQWDSDAPYMQQWNLNIQRQITTDWLVTANYIGNNTIHYPIGVQLNPAVFMGLGPCTINGVNYSTCSTTANTNQRRVHYLKNPSPGQYYAQIGEMQNIGTANYHGLLLSSQKRMSNGVSVLANYTWSHCISDPWENSLGGPSILPGNRKAFHSNCSSGDTRHIFNLSAVLQMPRFSSPRLRWLASDWQLSPIIQTRSAQFFTVTQGVDTALSGISIQTPNLVGNPYPSDQNVNRWIDRAAFQTPALGTYGNLGHFNMKGPGVFQFDVALSRTFAIGEGKTVQLRSEAFNILNHANFAPPASALNSAAFGQIQRAGEPRILQFALKFGF